jgi:hypothetical protein
MGEDHAQRKAKVVGHSCGIRIRVMCCSVVCFGASNFAGLPGKVAASASRPSTGTALLLQFSPICREKVRPATGESVRSRGMFGLRAYHRQHVNYCWISRPAGVHGGGRDCCCEVGEGQQSRPFESQLSPTLSMK